MKKYMFLFTFFLTGFCCSVNAQMAFGVSPGLGFNSAYLVLQASKNFLPYLGIQYVGAKYTYEEDSYKDEFSGSILIPTLGLKLFVGGTNNIRSYLNVAVSKPIVSGKLEYDGEPDQEFDDALDKLSLLGGEVGFGVEYFFDDNFSIGGEYGIRFSKIGVNFYFSRKTE
jgi:hypothetical protein